MLFQHATELAIRATLFLAQQAPGKLTPAHEIAAHVGVSEAYLAKILQRLASAGLVRSFRGPGKGMELGREASVISLSALVNVMEGAKQEEECVLGLGICSESHPCALHQSWGPLRNGIRELLEKTTLADLSQEVRDGARESRGSIASSRPADDIAEGGSRRVS